MKHLFHLFVLAGLFAGTAQAQVKFEYYNVEDNYLLLNLPTNSIMLTRFDAIAPFRVQEISAWFVTPTIEGQADLVMFGKEGGYHFPYQLKPLFQPVRVTIPAGKDSLFRFRFTTPVDIGGPGQFFVGIIKRSDDLFVRMDRLTQQITCANDELDSSFTNTFAQYNAATSSYAFGAWFNSRLPINNWYMGASGEYYNENPQPSFSDATVETGLNASQSDNPRLAWGDFDGDGRQDLLSGNRLYRNKPDGTFEDVAASVGYTAGSRVQMFVDVDNDADLDIVCQPDNYIYINTAGSFARLGTTGLGSSVNTQAMSFADYNNDGFPDFFVGNGEYMYMKNPNNPQDSALVEGAAWQGYLYTYKSGAYVDNTANVGGYQKGSYGRNPYNRNQTVDGWRPSTAVQWVDFDNDGDMDLFVGNDRLQPNSLFENQGTPFFRSVAQAHGAQGGTKSGYSGLYGNTRGCDFGDVDNDGTMDLLTGETAIPFELVYSDLTSVWKNTASSAFSFSNNQAVAKLGYTVYQADVAWADFDNDGRLDFYVTTGERCYTSSLYRQNQDGSFTDVTFESGASTESGLGTAWADFDNDGDLDLAVASEFGLRLFRNETPQKGNWVELNLKASTGNSHALGARVRVHAGGKVYLREVVAGKGAGTQQPYVLHFGLGSAAAIDSVLIRWPGKKNETVKGLAINQIHTITQKSPTSVKGETAAASVPDLQQNYPNPFSKSRNGSTSIAYNLPRNANILLEIFDMRGARVKTLVRGTQTPGMHFMTWDGRSDTGAIVPNGTYQYILTADGSVLTKQLVVLK